MNAATILCSDKGVLAVNYKTKWKFENSILSHELVEADPPFMEILSEDVKKTRYSILSLTANKLALKELNTNVTFEYIRK